MPVLWPACRSATPPTYIHPSKPAGLRRLLTLNLGLKFNFIMFEAQKHSNWWWWVFHVKVKKEPKIRMAATRRNLFPKSKKDRVGTKSFTNPKGEVSKLNGKGRSGQTAE
jgi:hypothetical protein